MNATKVLPLNFVRNSLFTWYLIIYEISRAVVASRSTHDGRIMHGRIMFQKPGSIHCTEIGCNAYQCLQNISSQWWLNVIFNWISNCQLPLYFNCETVANRSVSGLLNLSSLSSSQRRSNVERNTGHISNTGESALCSPDYLRRRV